MYYVGIDIAKYKHDCFIFTSEGEIVLESFTFENTREGFSKLKLILDALDHSQKIKTGLEATGIYGKNLKLFLSSIGYDFDELNPLKSNVLLTLCPIEKPKLIKSTLPK